MGQIAVRTADTNMTPEEVQLQILMAEQAEAAGTAGDATAANQTTEITKLSSIDAKSGGTPIADTVIQNAVTGSANGTALTVTGLTIAAVTISGLTAAGATAVGEGSIASGTFEELPPVKLINSSGATIATDGIYRFNVSGLDQFRLRLVNGVSAVTVSATVSNNGVLNVPNLSQVNLLTGFGTTIDAPVADNTTVTSATAATGIGLWKRLVNLGIAILAKLPSLGTAGTASANVITVQGIASGTVVPTSNTNLTNFGAGEYETVAASQTAQPLGATGATGDYISGLLVIPATVGCGVVTLLDGATSIPVFVGGGTTALPSCIPFFIPLGLISVSGAWKVTTGANVSVIGSGNFT